MECFQLILLCCFTIVNSIDFPDETEIPEEWPLSLLEFELVILPNQSQHLHLQQTNRVLANEHLPVWVFKEMTDPVGTIISPRLEPVDGVMDLLGNFTFYQDPVTTSAAVYYHQRQQLDGMIDTRYLIQGLNIDKISSEFTSRIELGTSGIINRPQSIELWPHTPVSSRDFIATVEYEVKETYQSRLYEGYPEILIIASCELARELLESTEGPDRYTPIISHILTLFNGVDMLYSKLQKTKIELNIAGILIDNECSTNWLFEDCYGEMFNKVKQFRSIVMNDECIFDQVHKYIFEQRDVIPIDSYDVVVFLSGSQLIVMRDGKLSRSEGSTSYQPVYDTKKLDIFSTPIAAIHVNASTTNYATIAHALAHLMNVNHDKDSFEGALCENTMSSNESFGQLECISWSDSSEREFQRFFSSTDCCGFINYPRSLHAERQGRAFTADDQCLCYGYESAIRPDMFSSTYCNSVLRCQIGGEVHATLFPINGTWCGNEKMCWQRNCTNIDNSKLYNL